MLNSDDKKKYFLSVASVVFNADLFSDSNKKFKKILDLSSKSNPHPTLVAISTYRDGEEKYSNIIVYPDVISNDPAALLNRTDRHQFLLKKISTSEANPVWISVPKTNKDHGPENIVTKENDGWENLLPGNTNEAEEKKEEKKSDPESFKNISDRKITHIIPEVIPGHLQKMGIGQVGHIVLSVVTQRPNETFQDAYQKHRQVFDPRDFGLSAQNTFDDTNCGRYVTAMTIQAAGLARDGFVINHANLRVSPAVGAALHFNSEEDAKIGLKHAYVKPLSEKPTHQEIIDHNVEKMRCLKAEYEARRQNAQRAYHGTSLFGGYRFAGFFSTIFFGYSAAEKLQVTQEIENRMKDNKPLDLSTLPSEKEKKIATQGRLGECVKAILEAQQQAHKPIRNRYEKIERFGL